MCHSKPAYYGTEETRTWNEYFVTQVRLCDVPIRLAGCLVEETRDECHHAPPAREVAAKPAIAVLFAVQFSRLYANFATDMRATQSAIVSPRS
jgi:hypothetical protein